jgi:uncharacterized protein (TIGR02611 family)
VTDPARSRALPPRRAAKAVKVARRAGVATAGTTLLGAGAVMLVLPGPGLLVLIAGLAVLATEFAWAERQLQRAKAYATDAARAARRRTSRSPRHNPRLNGASPEVPHRP